MSRLISNTMINLSSSQLELTSLNKVQTEATGKRRKVCMSFAIVIGDVSMSGTLSSSRTFSSRWKFGSVCLLSFLWWRWYKETDSTTTYFSRRMQSGNAQQFIDNNQETGNIQVEPWIWSIFTNANKKNYNQLRRLLNLQNVYSSNFYRVFLFFFHVMWAPWCRRAKVKTKKGAVEFLFFLIGRCECGPKRNQSSFIKSMTASPRGTTRRCPLIKDVGGNDSSSLSAWQRRISADKMPDHKLCLL